MKRNLLFTLLLLITCTVGYTLLASRASTHTTPEEESREQREAKRAARQAAYEKRIDSIVLSRSFSFNPASMQQSTGEVRMLQNPNFGVTTWKSGMVEVFLPYIKGYVPPYHMVILNYTLPKVEDYTTEQSADGWHVAFSSSLFSVSMYHFIFDISSRYGGATLTIKNAWYNDVTYSGTITQY